jgi:hypothetical protein
MIQSINILKAFILIHLYYKTSSSTQIQEVIDALEVCKKIDISNITTLENDEIYLVEINTANKDFLMHIRKLLQSKTQNLIYFFINNSQSLMLFQLASMLKVNNIFTPKHETSKLISIIKKDIDINKTNLIEHAIVKTLTNEQCFMIFDSTGLKFASQKLYDEFECSDLEMVKSKVCLQFDLSSFLEQNSFKKEKFNFASTSKTYNIKSITSTFNADKYIYLEDVSKVANNDKHGIDFIKNRIYFIEILKEKILQKSISNSILSIITIQVENMHSLRSYWSEYEIEMATRDLLLQVEIEIESHTLLAQYNNNLYLTLFEDLDFEAIKLKASAIQTHISAYTSKQKIKPIIGLYAFDINDLELNNILKIIADISNEDISSQDIQTQKLHKVINIDSELDDERAIDILLQATFTNKTPIKLLNIYKGLCINTASTIMKKNNHEIYVTYEQLQGTVMQFKKETVLQSSNFTKDIEADVAYIDSAKKLALLKNFKFVQGSANARKYSRVTCSQRTPISIVYNKRTLNGEILDISMNSIAIQTRIHPNIDTLKTLKVSLKFTLPLNNTEDGFVNLTLTAEVIFTMCKDEFCKVVVNLDEDQVNESILMEYVYNRQKEIIVELKKQTTMLNKI